MSGDSWRHPTVLRISSDLLGSFFFFFFSKSLQDNCKIYDLDRDKVKDEMEDKVEDKMILQRFSFFSFFLFHFFIF